VLDLALYRLPDDSYLVEWFWVQDQETPPTAYRHEVAECETFLVALHRLATFDIAAWDTRAEALTQYDWDVQVLLEDFFAQP
jgi:hypothetical protein